MKRETVVRRSSVSVADGVAVGVAVVAVMTNLSGGGRGRAGRAAAAGPWDPATARGQRVPASASFWTSSALSLVTKPGPVYIGWPPPSS